MAIYFVAMVGLPAIVIFSIGFLFGGRPIVVSSVWTLAVGVASWLIFWIGLSALTRSWDKFAGNLLTTLGPVLLTTVFIGFLGIGARRLISFVFGG